MVTLLIFVVLCLIHHVSYLGWSDVSILDRFRFWFLGHQVTYLACLGRMREGKMGRCGAVRVRYDAAIRVGGPENHAWWILRDLQRVKK
jgi:hypothetical protein